jgi:class 3 adenylate cyclase
VLLQRRTSEDRTLTLPDTAGHNGGVTVHHRAFLFTDIVGSTAKWEADSPEMLKALALHDTVLRDSIEPEAGVVFGDQVEVVRVVHRERPASVDPADLDRPMPS